MSHSSSKERIVAQIQTLFESRYGRKVSCDDDLGLEFQFSRSRSVVVSIHDLDHDFYSHTAQVRVFAPSQTTDYSESHWQSIQNISMNAFSVSDFVANLAQIELETGLAALHMTFKFRAVDFRNVPEFIMKLAGLVHMFAR